MLAPRILSVDDEELIRDLLVQHLSDSGYEVEALGDPRQALDSVQQNDYDLVLLDMKMPGMTGQEFFSALLNSRPEMTSRVIFVTGDIVSQETRQFLKFTGRPALEKPFDLSEMSRVVAQELSANMEQDQAERSE